MPESTHILVFLGLLFLTSQIAGRVAGMANVPRVVGYLLVGIMLGPSLVGVLDHNLIEHRLSLITDIALAIIAFSIGGSLHVNELRLVGKSIFVITLVQAFGAAIVVGVALCVYGGMNGLFDSESAAGLVAPMTLVVAAISAATAPAAVLGIVHQYRARGPLTNVLLGVVAIDDGLTLLLYAFAMATAEMLVGLVAQFQWMDALQGPIREIGIAVLVGGVVGLLFRVGSQWFTQRNSLLAFAIGAILLNSGLAMTLHASSLLANMALGFFVANFIAHSDDIFHRIEDIEEPIFGLFFAVAGAHLDLSLLTVAGGLAVLLTVFRFAGKVSGAGLATRMFRVPLAVRKYLGVTLTPQAGVTIGLILDARSKLASGLAARPDFQQAMQTVDYFVNAVLASVVINELLTPFLLRRALIQAGEAHNSVTQASNDEHS